MMDIKFLWELAKKDPALARAINIGILGSIAVLLTTVLENLTGLGIWWEILIPFFTALGAYIDKRIRDEKHK